MRVEDFEVAEFEFVGFELGIDKVMLNTIAYCIFCMYFFFVKVENNLFKTNFNRF